MAKTKDIGYSRPRNGNEADMNAKKDCGRVMVQPWLVRGWDSLAGMDGGGLVGVVWQGLG